MQDDQPLALKARIDRVWRINSLSHSPCQALNRPPLWVPLHRDQLPHTDHPPRVCPRFTQTIPLKPSVKMPQH